MMQARQCAFRAACRMTKPQGLINHSSNLMLRKPMWIGLERPSSISFRPMAFITGHKKTRKKNKKKRAAIQKKLNKKNSTKQRQQSAATPKAPFHDSPTPKDYPLGPNHQESPETQEDDVPPLMMAPTASRWAFVASAACKESVILPDKLFGGMEGMSLTKFRQEALFSSTGSFVYFSPKSLNYEYPKDTTQLEVAFLGRSNVGKSSLINALMGAKLAVTSKQPGRTQQPYYYGWVSDTLDRKKLDASMATAFLVDLPGYGFAVGPDKAVDGWQKATQDYLTTRLETGALRRVFVLQDARLGVPQPMDSSVCTWLEDEGIPYSVVLTKADAPTLAVKHANLCCLRYQQLAMEGGDDGCCMSPLVHITSAKKETGLVELLSAISSELKGS